MSREARVGVMFLIALALFGVAMYFLTNMKELVTYRIKFDKVNGLAADSTVEFRGVPIGRVTSIELSDEVKAGAQVPIIVTIGIHRTARNHIRTSTFADIRAVGILGDKAILLLTEDYGAPELEEDAFIATAAKALDVDRLLAQGEDLVTDVTAITKDLRTVLADMAAEEGALGSLIGDKKVGNDLKRALAGAADYMQQRDNLLGLLLKDPAFAAMVKSRLEHGLGNFEQLGERYKDADGLLPMLMEDQTFRDETRKRVLALLDDSQAVAASLREGKGLLQKMTSDEPYAERVSTNLEKASFHLASILEKIDTGDGTAAMVLNDPSLYQGLYEVVYGLKHSGLSKWYIQNKQKKGAALLAKPDPTKKKETP